MEILTAILTVVGVLITNIALVISLFLWVRTDSKDDIRHMETKLESNRELVKAIHEEIKYFHNRLCQVEEKNKK